MTAPDLGPGRCARTVKPREQPCTASARRVSITVTHEGGTPRPVRTAAVRHGDVTAVRTAVGGAPIASPAVLTPVIEAQDAKLR
ncbi:hypothetical protein [Streptomyces sp. WAC04114]|uniref:hypothetical protein n=1 Tax=Streptomyces sp. WAC04114 TaxID=2867961 RepID=UPI001C8C1EB8|nr:hypothetical protein [Streptomyces sp. WAC04114]MBX9361607.1 hypothetical protein [Streptomyces sp. WAC04114]